MKRKVRIMNKNININNDKKMKQNKNKETRQKEISNILKQLNEIDISHNLRFNIRNFVELKDFLIFCKDYIETGKNISGKIVIPSINRELQYDFPKSNNKECNVLLKVL